MNIELEKESNTRHKLRCIREDGSVEEASLETKSFLIHDFTHLAYELEAGLKESFWGSVASGKGFVELREPMASNPHPDDAEIVQTEMIVGPLQAVMMGKRKPKELLEGLKNQFDAYDAQLPSFLTVDFIKRSVERYRHLFGEWTALPFGETMHVEW